MGIGRKDFIVQMSVALTGLAISPLSAVAINDDFYVNKRLGMLFRKPHHWGYVGVADFEKLKEKQIINNEFDNSEIDLWQTLGEPACLITKYYEDRPENFGVFSPTIQVFVNHKSEFSDMEYSSFKEFIKISRTGVSMMLKDFKIQEEKEPYLKNGNYFFEYSATYLFEHSEIKGPLEVNLNVIIVEHNNFYYYFNFHDSPAQGQTATNEFDEFKKSLRLI